MIDFDTQSHPQGVQEVQLLVVGVLAHSLLPIGPGGGIMTMVRLLVLSKCGEGEAEKKKEHERGVLYLSAPPCVGWLPDGLRYRFQHDAHNSPEPPSSAVG
jgi:hypothetical protein